VGRFPLDGRDQVSGYTAASTASSAALRASSRQDQGEGERDDRLDRNEHRSLESRAEGCADVEHDAETLANGLRAEIGVGAGSGVGLEARGPAGVENDRGVPRAVLSARHQQRLAGQLVQRYTRASCQRMVVADVPSRRLVAQNRGRQPGDWGGQKTTARSRRPLTDVAQERPGRVLAGVQHDPGRGVRPALEHLRHDSEPRRRTQPRAQQPAR
jgi:hypothetical protein